MFIRTGYTTYFTLLEATFGSFQVSANGGWWVVGGNAGIDHSVALDL